MTTMTVKQWSHSNVDKFGHLKSGGKINVIEGVYTSEQHACTLPECKCDKRPWIMINFGYSKENREVSGVTIYFDSQIIFNKFLQQSNLQTHTLRQC